MKTIVISDTAFLGDTYEQTKEGIYYIKCLQKYGYQVIVMSNKPRNDAKYISFQEKDHQMIISSQKEKNQKEGILFEIEAKKEKTEISLFYDYLISENGIQITDKKDKVLYNGYYFSDDYLKHLKKFLETYQYVLKEKESIPTLKQYSFLKNDESLVFGFQLNQSNLNAFPWQDFERNFPDLDAYLFSKRDVEFYSRGVNKRIAFEYLCLKEKLMKKELFFVLSNPTDQVFLDYYRDSCYWISSKSKSSNLVRTLEKIDS